MNAITPTERLPLQARAGTKLPGASPVLRQTACNPSLPGNAAPGSAALSAAAGTAAPAPRERRRAALAAALPWRRWRTVWGRVPLSVWLAWAVVAVVLCWAVWPSGFAGHDPLTGLAGQQLRAPSSAHWLGTDALGRDVWARVVYGAVHSLSGALVAVGVGLCVGTTMGLLAGAVGGWLDDALMRLVDVLLAVPSLLLSLSIIILLGFGTVNAAIAVGLASVASFARLVRSEVVRVRRADYVEAAFGSGGRFHAVLWRHVLPNSLTSVVALGALQFGSAILAIATLGFLGYGAPPPTPEWGLLIAEGRNYLATAWWLTTAPGVVVVLVVLAVNRISRAVSGGAA